MLSITFMFDAIKFSFDSIDQKGVFLFYFFSMNLISDSMIYIADSV